MRQKYETDRDILNELEVKEYIENNTIFHRLVKQSDTFSEIDFFGYGKSNGEAVEAAFEIKCRNMTWGQYPDIMLSAKKVDSLLRYVYVTKNEAYFVVRDNNGVIKYCPVTNYRVENRFKIEFGGRTKKTRDPRDCELVFKIPNELFLKFKNERDK